MPAHFEDRSPVLTCPTCQKRFRLDRTRTPPFCCERCQLIDLGQWLNETHGLPYEGGPGEASHDTWDEE